MRQLAGLFRAAFGRRILLSATFLSLAIVFSAAASDINYVHNRFNGGEISDVARGQIDLTKYVSGSKKMENFVALSQGPATLRPGTKYFGIIPDGANYRARLIPFQKDVDEWFVLYFTTSSGNSDFHIIDVNDEDYIPGPELIHNGGMEACRSWTYSYTATTTEIYCQNTEQVNSGNYSFKIQPSAAGGGLKTRYDFPIDEIVGTTSHDLDFWIYPSSSGTRDIRIIIKDISGSPTILDTTKTITGLTWNNVTDNFTSSSALDRATLEIVSTATNPTMIYYLDDVSLKRHDGYDTQFAFYYDHPYNSNEIFDLDYVQNHDNLYIAHQNHQPYVIERWADDAFFMIPVEYEYQLNLSTTHTWLAAGSGANDYYVTLFGTATVDPLIDKPIGVYEGGYFSSNALTYSEDITDLSAGQWGYGDKDSLGFNTIYVNLTDNTDPDSKPSTYIRADLERPEWNDTDGYPGTVFFHNDRLGFSAHPKEKERIWMSRTGLYNDFTYNSPVNDDDALDLKLSDEEQNQILFMRSIRGLIGLSEHSEWRITGADGSGLITATSKYADKLSKVGSDNVRPVIVDNILIHSQRHGKKISELVYDYTTDSFGGLELTAFAEHLTETYDIREFAFQRHPHRILWCVRDDGVLLGLTYNPRQGIYAWHQHKFGGNEVTVDSIAAIPSDGYDQLWMIVKRKINGANVRSIETMAPFFKKPDIYDQYDAYFLDDATTDAWFLDSAQMADHRVYMTTTSDISNANPAVLTHTSHGLNNNDVFKLRYVNGLLDSNGDSAVNGQLFKATNVTANTLEMHTYPADEDFNATGLTDFVATIYTGSGSTHNVPSFAEVFGGSGTGGTGGRLEGEVIGIVADGKYLGTTTVSSGSYYMPGIIEASVLIYGLPYEGNIVTLPIEVPTPDGPSSQGRLKRITRARAMVKDTHSFKFGKYAKDLQTYIDGDYLKSIVVGTASPSGDSDGPTTIETKTIDPVSFRGGREYDPMMHIRCDQAMPCTVISLFSEVEVSD